MKKKPYFLIGGSILICLFLAMRVLTTRFTSFQPNNFKRVFYSKPAQKVRQIENSWSLFRISGKSHQSYYFTKNASSDIYVFDTNLVFRKSINLHIDTSEISLLMTRIFVDSPKIYMAAINIPAIIRDDMDVQNCYIQNVKRRFTRVIKISADNFIFRGFDSLRQNMILFKENLVTKDLMEEHNITDRLSDGGFATDGMLLYDNETSRLLFVHYYCNKIFCIDTNLKLTDKFSTIDTFNSYTTIGGSSKQGHKIKSYTFSKPPILINYRSCISSGKLFVNSAIKADNENPDTFTSNNVFDVYIIPGGKYLGSFYIPKSNGKKLTDFKVYGNNMILLEHSMVSIYRLQL